ncbi:BTAD domain-containing putative transcriptional regulator [Streptomyces sp. NPDC059752]|uniref:BTAD domain-containing putative transcriptional regulator n=1 Tax=unclassified Streptomyces TaxID=2593676 RepID=UPI0036488425
MHAQLIIALNKSERHSEALHAYQTMRDLLRRELGLEPSLELWRLHQEILAAGSRSHPSHGPVPLAPRRSPAHRASVPTLWVRETRQAGSRKQRNAARGRRLQDATPEMSVWIGLRISLAPAIASSDPAHQFDRWKARPGNRQRRELW